MTIKTLILIPVLLLTQSIFAQIEPISSTGNPEKDYALVDGFIAQIEQLDFQDTTYEYLLKESIKHFPVDGQDCGYLLSLLCKRLELKYNFEDMIMAVNTVEKRLDNIPKDKTLYTRIVLAQWKMSYYFNYDVDWEQSEFIAKSIMAEAGFNEIISTTTVDIHRYLAGHYQIKREYDKAIAILTEAQNLFKNDLGSTFGIQSMFEGLYEGMGEYEKALQYNQKNIALIQQVNDKETLSFLYMGQSDFHGYRGEKDKAIQSARLAVENQAGILQQLNLSRKLLAGDKYEEALAIAQKLVILITEDFDNEDVFSNPGLDAVFREESVVEIFVNKYMALMKIYNHGGDEKYEKVALETFQLVANLANTNYYKESIVNEGVRVHKLGNKNSVYVAKLLAILRQYQNKATPATLNDIYFCIEKLKSGLVFEVRHTLRVPPKIAEERNRLIQTYHSEHFKFVQGDRTALPSNTYATAKNNLKTFERKELLQYVEDVETSFNETIGDYKSIQANMAADEVYLNYFVQPCCINVLVVTQTNIKLLKLEGIKQELEKKVDTLNKQLQSPLLKTARFKADFIKNSHEIYNIFFAPVAAELEGKKNICVIPHDFLFRLPFELLLSGEQQGAFHELDFLLKKYQFRYHYSMSLDYLLSEKKDSYDMDYLGFAPIFEKGKRTKLGSKVRATLRSESISAVKEDHYLPLPNTQEEVSDAMRYFEKEKGRLLIGEGANKESLLESITEKDYRIVHLASHSIHQKLNSASSALVCYPKGDGKELLEVRAIHTQDIKTDLVVLSSCESGVGDFVSGEGLISLNRAFIRAGANNVVFTLWKIDDKYSAQLMQYFFEALKKEENYSKALHVAKLKMLEQADTASPGYWGAFLIIGA